MEVEPEQNQPSPHHKGIYTWGEELAHAITHGIGAAASIAGLAVLVGYAMVYGDKWHVIACSIFGASLIILYLASTLYHSITHPRIKSIFQVIDHSAIYLLIAGTYTPFLLVTFRDSFGLPMLAAIWALAFTGVGFKLFFTGRFEKTSTAIYVAMGWIVLLIIRPFAETIPDTGVWLMVLGGLAYTGGVVFFIWERLPYNHAIWHGFVMAGSVLHYFAILFFVVPFPFG